ncbi:MAG: response regulator transcription factor [Bacillota bacterium]
METILVVEDEESVRDLVSMYLKKEGFRVETAEDGEKALTMARSFAPDLILLDLMLPKLDGWAVCREIRKTTSVPIIMLTARGEEFDRVLGLELGADDYITKPFSPREMVARVKAVLRRAKLAGKQNTVLSYPGLLIDHSASRVEAGGREIQLTPKEFELLWFLASHPRRVYSREQLLENVWGYAYPGDPRTVDTHVKRLREKLKNPGAKNYIVTVWGKGYRFETAE